MPVAKARILRGHFTLFQWKIIKIEENSTIQGLFKYIIDQYVPQLKDEMLEKIEVHCSESKEQIGDEIELECIASDVISIFGSHFTFRIKPFTNHQPINAFDILINATKERHLPIFDLSEKPKANDQLKLDILSYISFHKGGWTYDAISIGKKFIKELSDALWYIDKCGHSTFNDRYKIPAEFSQFFNRFDPVKDKKSRPKFTYDELNFHSQNLTAYLKMSWIEHPCFAFLRPSIIKFANNLQKYAEYLVEKGIQTKKNHKSLAPIVNEEDAGKLKIILPVTFRTPTTIAKYKDLIQAVESMEYWEIINVDPFCPNNNNM